MGRIEIAEGTHLRLLREDDAGELHALIVAERPRLAEWLPWAGAQTEADTIDYLRRARVQLESNDGFQAAIVRDGRIAGAAGFHRVDWVNRLTSIGYWLGSEWEGEGTMTAAVRALVAHAFATWDLNRVEIQAAVENTRSRAIPERLDFRQEGIRREAERVGDRYLDCALYALLAAEWRGGA